MGQRFSPRRPTSSLSELNRERVRRLIAAKKMTQAGLKAIAHVFDVRKDTAKKLKWEMPRDIVKELQRDATVWKNFRRFPESYKRIRLGWITAARHRPDIFKTRLQHFLKKTAQNKRFGTLRR